MLAGHLAAEFLREAEAGIAGGGDARKAIAHIRAGQSGLRGADGDAIKLDHDIRHAEFRHSPAGDTHAPERVDDSGIETEIRARDGIAAAPPDLAAFHRHQNMPPHPTRADRLHAQNRGVSD